MKRLIVLTAGLLLPYIAVSQTLLRGKVSGVNKQALHGAHILLAGSETGTVTDTAGRFLLTYTDTGTCRIIVSYTGYKTDTLDIRGRNNISINLEAVVALPAAGVRTGATDAHIGRQTIKTEVITQGELKKAACCDLAGCFETQGTVQPMTTNIITNSKELRILGLSGVYNQVLTDGVPLIQGLSYTYGISSIPGTLVDNIYVAKGTTSVLQGYESMVGQINVIPKSPDKGEKMLLNAYVNSFGENHYNANFRHGKGKWSNLIAAHTVQPAQTRDRDHDDFLDLPKLTRYMLYDKIKYGDENKKGLSLITGFRYLWERRIGGQKGFDAEKDLGSNTVYGQKVQYTQPELYTKTGYRFSAEKKITLIASAYSQAQQSWFGTVNYKANQKTAYANLQYEWQWSSSHELKTGASFRYLNLEEQIAFSDTALKRTYNGSYLKRETIPGLFAENTFRWRGDIITLITGIRADHHNLFGWQITPRSMLKYELTEKAVLRASAGTGWRTVNLFSENIGLLVSSRNIVFKENLEPEKAFNWGLNLLQKFTAKHLEGFMTFDFYQTRFQNQFFPDYDTDPTKAFIGNFGGRSVSNGFQADLNAKFYKIIEAKLAYNYLDVYRVINGSKVQLPFNAKHKLLLSLSFAPKNKKWRADFNAHWFGKQRLPNTENNPEAFRQPKTSRPYVVFNIQLTRSWRKLDIYAGCENLADYRQLKPIVSWQNPFSPYFDTSFNWGPTRGRELYIGIRCRPF